MPIFTFKGTDAAGATITGERPAENKQALEAILKRERITPVSIKAKGKGFNFDISFGGGVSSKELSIFTRQFSVMIDAGLPLVQCLEILSSQQENPTFKTALAGTRSKVEGGSTLANAMREYPKAFDDLYVNMVEAGETGGILDGILQRLATQIEKNVKLKGAVKSASIYPASVLGIMAVVITGLMWGVVPTFAKLFVELGVDLPLPTKITIGISDFVVNYIVFVIIGGVIGVFVIKSYYKTPAGRYAIDNLMLHIPLVGILLRKIAVARFTSTLGTLISSGVPILEGLAITAKTSGNAVIEKALMQVRAAVEEGRTIVEPLKKTQVFPSMVTQMIGVGEQTGALDAMLAKVGQFYEDEVDEAVKDMLAAMEPMIMAVLGVVVGGIVISLYLPIFELIAKLSG
jgi:type IV pilus assembly protein PilC